MLAAVPALWHAGRRERCGWLTPLVIVACSSLWMALTLWKLGGISHFLDPGAAVKDLLREGWRQVSVAAGGRAPGAGAVLEGAGRTAGAGGQVWARAFSALSYQWGATGVALISVILAPLAALPAVANWGAVVLAEGLATPESFHYLAPTAAAVLFGWAVAVPRVAAWGTRIGSSARSRFRNDLEEDRASSGPLFSPAPRVGCRTVAGLLVVANLGYLALAPPPGVDSCLRVLSGRLRPETRVDSAWPLILQIPPEAPVLTDDMFVSALVNRRVIYDADEIFASKERRMVIDTVSWALLLEGSSWVGDLEAFGFRRLGASGGAVLLERLGEPPLDGPSFCLP